MRKKLIALTLALVLLLLLPLNTFASYSLSTDKSQNQSRYKVIQVITAGLNGESGFVKVSGSVVVNDPSLQCYVTVELQEYENNQWTTVDAWHDNGIITVGVSKDYYLLPGNYRAKTTARIYDASNALIETVSVYYDP